MTDLFPGVEADAGAATLKIDGDGIGWLTIDTPNTKLNVLSGAVLKRLNDLITQCAQDASAGRLKSLVIRSGKAGSFVAGADVKEIASITDPAVGTRAAHTGQQVFVRLAALPIPSVAAVDGICLGGGTELILACTYRIATDRPETKIGLPEVQLGILPGFGGTTRLPRLVGMQAALEMILAGKPVDARKAERIGLIDEKVHPAILEKRAREVAKAIQGKLEWPRDKKQGLASRLLETGPGRKVMLSKARQKVMKETRGKYPAPLRALDILERTLSISVDESLALEADAIGQLIVTPVSKNLVHVFHLVEASKKAAPGVSALQVQRVAVVGAGVMGGGIAQIVAYRGLHARMKDIKPDAIALGLRHAWEAFDGMVKRRRLKPREARQMMDRISPTLDYSGFRLVDVVIEAVVEKMEVKKSVLTEVEKATRADAVLTTNTSSLSVSELQKGLQRPEQFCGMHFFNPVNRMPLVEVIRGERSSDEAVATVFALARKLEKTPIIVEDGPGFLVNRILAPYLNEAGHLLAEGGGIKEIDDALVDFGMPMGPLRLLDEVGLDVSRHAGATMFEAFGDRMKPAAPLIALGSSKRLGKKNESGFYKYEGGKHTEPDESIYADLGAQATRRALGEQLIVERSVYAMVNEAARILEDKIVSDAGQVDLGMIMGTGFPPFRGGLLRYADSVGLQHIVKRLELFSKDYGPRFEPAPLLRKYAEAGRGFYAE